MGAVIAKLQAIERAFVIRRHHYHLKEGYVWTGEGTSLSTRK